MSDPAAPSQKGTLDEVKLVALDLDGVVYLGKKRVPGADTAIQWLRDRGYTVRFVTNASGISCQHIADKLCGLGIPAEPADVYTSAVAAALLLGRLRADGVRTVHVCGARPLVDAIAGAGFEIVDDGGADALVVGFDTAFDYDRLARALRAARKGTLFIAANLDTSYPVEDGSRRPGCGPLVAAVECAVGRPPDYIAGKPNVTMLAMLCSTLSLTHRDILMVGDSLESDIAMADRFHSLSVLCAPGAPDVATLSPRPDYVIETLRELPNLLVHQGVCQR